MVMKYLKKFHCIRPSAILIDSVLKMGRAIIVIENKISRYINDDKEIFSDDPNKDASDKEIDKE